MGVLNWWAERRQHRRLVQRFLSFYGTDVQAHNDEESKAFQDALLIKFQRLGLQRIVEDATGFHRSLWTNWNKDKKARYNPVSLSEWVVDIAPTPQPYYLENRVVSCRNPLSAQLNSGVYIYPTYMNVCLFKWYGGQRHYVWVNFRFNGSIEIVGAEVTFYGKPLLEDTHLGRQQLMLALLQAMDKPAPDMKDLTEKREREANIA